MGKREGVRGHDVNAYLARHVPITRAMGIRLRAFDAAGVTMTAPLAPNINDKGIAFGGTIASILALSGWALTDLALRRAGEVADVLIATATTEYLAPVASRIVARCPLPPPEDLAGFVDAYRRHGRARLRLMAHIEAKSGPAARFEAVYLARRPAEPGRSTSATTVSRPISAPRIRRRCGRSRSAPCAQC
jgi:thioesterase domain-containing protein